MGACRSGRTCGRLLRATRTCHSLCGVLCGASCCKPQQRSRQVVGMPQCKTLVVAFVDVLMRCCGRLLEPACVNGAPMQKRCSKKKSIKKQDRKRRKKEDKKPAASSIKELLDAAGAEEDLILPLVDEDHWAILVVHRGAAQLVLCCVAAWWALKLQCRIDVLNVGINADMLQGFIS